MKHGEQIGELAAALAKAQAAMKGALADSSNPHFKSRYADLESVRCACIPALTANGVAVVQGLSDGKCITRLVHSSGQWIETEVPLIIGKNDMQGVGSAITYARRYGLAAAVCLSQTDDDGNAACATFKPAATKPVAPIQPAAVKIDPGLLTDGYLPDEPSDFKAKQFAAGPYSDDADSKKWLVRELEYFGIGKRLANHATICTEVHGLCLGKTRPDAQKIIENWAASKGFKKG